MDVAQTDAIRLTTIELLDRFASLDIALADQPKEWTAVTQLDTGDRFHWRLVGRLRV